MNNIIEGLKDSLVEAARRAYTRGIQSGSGGNFSCRIPGEDLMIVKASGGSFIDTNRDNLLVTDFDGTLVEGKGKPTREALLHGLLYRITKAQAVMHCHSPWAIACASTMKSLENVTKHQVLKIGASIPVVFVDAAAVRVEDFPVIEQLYGEYPQLTAFILADHGVVSLAGTIIDAEHQAELVEETAQIACLKAILKQ